MNCHHLLPAEDVDVCGIKCIKSQESAFCVIQPYGFYIDFV